MTRIVAIAIAMFAAMTLCTSCLDQEPGEITVRSTQGGQPLDTLVMLYNGKGVQIQEHHTERGFVIIKAVKPGTYYVKLKDYSTPPTIYKAIRKVDVSGGDSAVVDMDVDDATQNPTDAPAELAGTPAA